MKTVDVEKLRKKYLLYAEIKDSEEIDSLISELKKYDIANLTIIPSIYLEEDVVTKDEVIVAMLKEIREEIGGLQTYKLFSGDTELYLSKDSVISSLDKKISELEKTE